MVHSISDDFSGTEAPEVSNCDTDWAQYAAIDGEIVSGRQLPCGIPIHWHFVVQAPAEHGGPP